MRSWHPLRPVVRSPDLIPWHSWWIRQCFCMCCIPRQIKLHDILSSFCTMHLRPSSQIGKQAMKSITMLGKTTVLSFSPQSDMSCDTVTMSFLVDNVKSWWWSFKSFDNCDPTRPLGHCLQIAIASPIRVSPLTRDMRIVYECGLKLLHIVCTSVLHMNILSEMLTSLFCLRSWGISISQCRLL